MKSLVMHFESSMYALVMGRNNNKKTYKVFLVICEKYVHIGWVNMYKHLVPVTLVSMSNVIWYIHYNNNKNLSNDFASYRDY